MLANPYNTYKKNQVETATPQQLVAMLYNGALKFLRLAQAGLDEKNLEKAHVNNVKVQDILTELMSTLDMSQGDVAVHLYQLYDYMQQQLLDANLKKQKEPLAAVEAMLTDLRDTWQQAMA